VDDFDRELTVLFVLLELSPDHIFLAHEKYLDAQVTGGSHRAFDFDFWGVVSAHCIEGNGQHAGTELLLDHFDNFTSLVLAAVGAHAVR
jgi:hypothetical protein